MSWREKQLAERREAIENGTATVYDIAEYWDSLIYQVEKNLEEDPTEWKRYLADPKPYERDLLGDFGDWQELGFGWGSAEDAEVMRKAMDAALTERHGG